tara:strand:- start:1714 stop:2988 length:1275 start_codon:yes stop_codon:yes gene_type:complete
MALNRDSVTAWTRANGDAIAKHRSQELPRRAGGPFGRSIFGFASQTLGLNPPSILGRLSPTDLFDTRALLDAGKDYALSKLGSALTGALAGGAREWLESQNHSNLYGAITGYRYNHEIENRGYLSFRFPSESYIGVLTPDDSVSIGGESFETFTLPFFENPRITESRSAEYATHKIVNRNEPYRLWTGAKPTKVNLDFNITLPHLLTFAHSHIQRANKEVLASNNFKEFLLGLIREKFDGGGEAESLNVMEQFPPGAPLSQSQLSVFNSVAGGSGDYRQDRYEPTAKLFENIAQSLSVSNEVNRAQLIVYTTYLLNLIRSSVLGSSNNSSEKKTTTGKDGNEIEAIVRRYLPAPVIFLTFGASYNNSPFIATNYSITFDGKSGYEELGLLPRVIQIKLTLESFNQFENSDRVFGIPKIFGDSRE